jgi:hypothetical protein
MTSEECHLRARICAESAEVALDAGVACQFMTLAAQWRAMALGERALGRLPEAADVCGPSRPDGREATK